MVLIFQGEKIKGDEGPQAGKKKKVGQEA